MKIVYVLFSLAFAWCGYLIYEDLLYNHYTYTTIIIKEAEHVPRKVTRVSAPPPAWYSDHVEDEGYLVSYFNKKINKVARVKVTSMPDTKVLHYVLPGDKMWLSYTIDEGNYNISGKELSKWHIRELHVHR